MRALVKLEQVLPRHLRRRVPALGSATVAPPLGGPTVDPQHLTVIAAACRDGECLRFAYRSRDGTDSRRDVEPHSLVNLGRRWYLVAWDRRREDWRTFRIDRLERPASTGVRFTPRALPAATRPRTSSRASPGPPNRYEARVTLHAPAADAAACPPVGRRSSRSTPDAASTAPATTTSAGWRCGSRCSASSSRSTSRRSCSSASRRWPTGCCGLEGEEADRETRWGPARRPGRWPPGRWQRCIAGPEQMRCRGRHSDDLCTPQKTTVYRRRSQEQPRDQRRGPRPPAPTVDAEVAPDYSGNQVLSMYGAWLWARNAWNLRLRGSGPTGSAALAGGASERLAVCDGVPGASPGSVSVHPLDRARRSWRWGGRPPGRDAQGPRGASERANRTPGWSCRIAHKKDFNRVASATLLWSLRGHLRAPWPLRRDRGHPRRRSG